MGLFKVRRTTTPGLIPAGLTYGEMAVNLADRILYVGNTAGDAIDIAGGGINRFFYQPDAPGLSQGFGLSGETGQYDYLIGSRWVDSDSGREYVFIGEDNEWTDIGGNLFQNKRCASIFKDATGDAYDIDGRVFWEWYTDKETGEKYKSYYTCYESRVPVTFPYIVPEERIEEYRKSDSEPPSPPQTEEELI